MYRDARTTGLTIGKKLLLMNVFIWVGFGVVVAIMFWASRNVTELLTSDVARETDQVILNADLARELSVVLADANLLLGTFRGNDHYLKTEGSRLLANIGRLERKASEGILKANLADLKAALEALLDQCNLLNMLLHRVQALDKEIEANLLQLDDLISEHILAQVAAGVDASIMEQRSVMVASFRESLLRIAKLFGQSGENGRPDQAEDNSRKAVHFLGELFIHLSTFTAPDPKADHLIVNMISRTKEYKLVVLRYEKEESRWRSRVHDFTQAKGRTIAVMKSTDRDIAKTVAEVQTKIKGIVLYSGAVVLVLSVLVFVVLGAVTSYFHDSAIRQPMKEIRRVVEAFGEGDLDSRIALNRKDEWNVIEKALNSMAADLSHANAELQRRQTELEVAEHKYRSIFENAAEGIYQSTPEGKYLNVNPAMASLLGYETPEELLTEVTDIAQQIYVEPHRRLHFLHLMRIQGMVRDFEVELYRKDGSKMWASTTARAIFDEQGNLLFNEGFLVDTTERKHLEEQLRQASKMQAIGQLAGGIAHDFNNLLTAMLGYSHMLMEQLPLEHPDRVKLLQISRAAERAADLTRQLLAFSRKQVLDSRILDLNAVIPDLEGMLKRLIGEDIQFCTRLDPSVSTVKADESQLHQILMNLVLNARDAMPRGGTLTIESSDAVLDEDYAKTHEEVQPGRYVMFAVSDTGTGMDSQTVSQVFEPFFTTKEKVVGTGLGLSTVYGIVKQHKGHVSAYSEPGHGSTFRVYLPAADVTPTAGNPVQSVAKHARGQETILIVEDEDIVRDLATEVLEILGYTVLQASNPDEALSVAEEQGEEIDLVLMDVVLPQMDGKQLFSRLAQTAPNLKVLHMSGYTNNAIVHHGVLAKGARLLQKPFTMDALSTKVREALDAGA